ncbi:DUF58 domain-containing protein [Neobacillus notoginsengisoli]|uniref:DUF58 domain-containing protein n=1 Tax=Neobacillus notoginsengisoli TaxID=1578198 RepID=A0A417YFF8_9BACI|nr:DUF58 domain-containing protein [Neobacillus notoginsengisoli]RHW31407.1 DUF58 domain-containing protein [Neobacillus notoginsengisoli]
MAWTRHLFTEKKIAAIQISSVILMLLSFYMDERFLFFAGSVAFIAITFNQLYEKRAGEGLEVEVERKRDRYFVDERGEWRLVFRNNGWPILNGEAKVIFDNAVEPMPAGKTSGKTLNEVTVPFSIMRGESKELSIPFLTRKRGLSKIRRLELTIPNLFGFGFTLLEYKLPLSQEVLVYPKRMQVAGKKEMITDRPGSQISSFSLYEDVLSPAGTREYSIQDGFYRIHWKASAKIGKLQTKLFDRVSEKGMMISINVAERHSPSPYLEELLESSADLVYFACSRHIPVSLCMNIRNAGDVPFYYVPPGEGREQLQKIYELLALASAENATLPYDKMMSYVEKHLHLLPTLIHGGEMTEQAYCRFGGMQKRGIALYQLKVENHHSTLGILRLDDEGRVPS